MHPQDLTVLRPTAKWSGARPPAHLPPHMVSFPVWPPEQPPPHMVPNLQPTRPLMWPRQPCYPPPHLVPFPVWPPEQPQQGASMCVFDTEIGDHVVDRPPQRQPDQPTVLPAPRTPPNGPTWLQQAQHRLRSLKGSLAASLAKARGAGRSIAAAMNDKGSDKRASASLEARPLKRARPALLATGTPASRLSQACKSIPLGALESALESPDCDEDGEQVLVPAAAMPTPRTQALPTDSEVEEAIEAAIAMDASAAAFFGRKPTPLTQAQPTHFAESEPVPPWRRPKRAFAQLPPDVWWDSVYAAEPPQPKRADSGALHISWRPVHGEWKELDKDGEGGEGAAASQLATGGRGIIEPVRDRA